jgi:hypothetical protein
MLPLLLENRVLKFSQFCPTRVSLFEEILSSKIVEENLALAISTDFKAIVKEFIDQTYLTKLPTSIQGLTLCNRTVMINCFSFKVNCYKELNVKVGFTLMTMLHEFGHFIQRFNLDKFYQWFEKETPLYEDKQEAGSELMKKIFGKEPEFINVEATEFLLNACNWNRSNTEFAGEFGRLNANSEEREQNNSQYQIRLKQGGLNPNVKFLGGCRYSGRIQNRSK